ncbi:UNVERIFIED_ORG: dihydrofolate reductase [Sphingomonas sp. R1F5B]
MRRHLTSIVAIDRNGAIGCKNHLPWQLKSDLAFFRKTTVGHGVLMGRKTFDSIGGCLKGRKNLILTKRAALYDSTENCQFFHTWFEALNAISSEEHDDTFVIGGAATYGLMHSFVDQYIVTYVDCAATNTDAFLEQQIIKTFTQWPSKTILEVEASSGKDDYNFRVVCYTSPRANEIANWRKTEVMRRMDQMEPITTPRHHLKSVFSI